MRLCDHGLAGALCVDSGRSVAYLMLCVRGIASGLFAGTACEYLESSYAVFLSVDLNVLKYYDIVHYFALIVGAVLYYDWGYGEFLSCWFKVRTESFLHIGSPRACLWCHY